MKTLFEESTLQELQGRLARLSAASERLWGKMNAAQMLAHCADWMELAAGKTSPPRSWMGYMFGGLAKRNLLGDSPIRRNMPTDKALLVRGERDFTAEQQRLAQHMDRFTAGGPEQCTKHPHNFFGPMTPVEWAILAYKHIDHHFRQFGV